MMLTERLIQYWYLMRFDKPIPILLLMWPTLWALWLASNGFPHPQLLIVFVTGVVLMRAAGCVMSDILDRDFDARVSRTAKRPLASGKINRFEAIMLVCLLSGSAFAMVLYYCHLQTIILAMLGAVIIVVYPLLKRLTHLPQMGLSVAFTWGVLMAFAEVCGGVNWQAGFLFLTGAIWPMIYDTFYAMVDRDDDSVIGVKSTALLFGDYDLYFIATLQLLFLLMLSMVGWIFQLRIIYFFSLLAVFMIFVYQLYITQDRKREQCLQAFLNNHWIGFCIFFGIYASYL